MEQFIKALSGFLWGNYLIMLCLVAGLFFTYRYKFLQIRYLKESIKLVNEKNSKSSDEGISPLQALTMALAGRIGTGNIVGVVTAIAAGGPGAVFWMWMLAIIGGGTSFVESTLAQIYKVKKFGEYRGGPAYYFEKGLGKRWLGILFAFILAFGNIILLPGVHANAIASSLKGAFGANTYLYGILLVIFLGVIIFGNVKRLATVSEYVVPFMSVAYILVALIIVVANITKVPEMLGLIFSSAFGVNAIFGGLLGAAITMGVKRGVYSSSAGMGTAPQSAAAAEISHPVKQGLVQSMSVFFDSIVCTATAFLVLITNSYNVVNKATGEIVVNHLGNVEAGAQFVQKAADTIFPGFGSVFIAIAIFFFSGTSLMAAYYIGETNLIYFLGENKTKYMKSLLFVIKVVFLGTVMFGSVRSGGIVWAINDVGTGLLVWINLVGILLLSGVVKKVLDDYEIQFKAGINPVFDPEKIGIKNAETWSSPEMKARYNTKDSVRSVNAINEIHM